MKNSLVPIAVILIVVAVFLIFNSTQTVKSIRQTLDLERYQRITAEEKLQHAETRIRMLESQVSDSEGRFDQIHTILEEKEAISEAVATAESTDAGNAVQEAELKEDEGSEAVQSEANMNP